MYLFTAERISSGVPHTQITLLIPVTSSSLNATSRGQRRLPQIMWERKSGLMLAETAICFCVILFLVERIDYLIPECSPLSQQKIEGILKKDTLAF